MNNLLCGCGREVRYSHFRDGNQVMSCNKRTICLTYEQQDKELIEVQRKYRQLLYEVRSKFPGETRHETALRYIKAMESSPPCSSVAGIDAT